MPARIVRPAWYPAADGRPGGEVDGERRVMRRRSWIAIGVLAAACFGPLLSGLLHHELLRGDPPRSIEVPQLDTPTLVERLASDSFATREDARRTLEARAAAPATADEVRRAVQDRLARGGVDFETNELLTALARRFPAPPAPEQRPPATAAEVGTWLDLLNAAEFVRREQAVAALRDAVKEPSAATLVLLACDRRLAAANIAPDDRRRLVDLRRAAWRAWLNSDSAKTADPTIDDARIDGAVARLTAGDPATRTPEDLALRALAERELLYWLARDDVLPRVKSRLEAALVDPAIAAADHGVVARLLDWTRPAMVAEIWKEGRFGTQQHLLIGVPNQPPGAPKASHFDRCDEKTAHCVSGNTLKEGDYPVGIFFPYISNMGDELQFHLVNLPTVRRRLRYDHEVPIDVSAEEARRIQSTRRAETTRRTVDFYLARKQLLSNREVDMLPYLDEVEAGRLVGPYLLGVDDQRLELQSPTAFGNGSRHGMFCTVVAIAGAAEAGPGLVAALEKGRVMPPTDHSPYRMDWVAVLTLCRRAPWPGVEDWLARQVDKTDPININTPDEADAGASAAAALVEMNGGEVSAFHLERKTFQELIDLENPAFRFRKPEGRELVKRWWKAKAEARKTSETP
jgi:hypothetical protein